MKRVLLAVLLTLPVGANAAPWKSIYKATVVSLLASAGTDVASSWGMYEGNPVLGRNQAFGVKGLSLKLAITGGVLLLSRHLPVKAAAIANVGATSAWTVVTVHNLKVQRVQ